MFKYLLLLILPMTVCASDIVAKYGVGINKHQTNVTNVKLIELSFDREVLGIFKEKCSIGFFADNTRVNSKLGYGSYMIGVEPKTDHMYFNGTSGVGLMSGTDETLGSAFQFFHEFGMGIYDRKSMSRIGIYFKHISNAGIKQPNSGRDFIGIQMGVSL